MSVTIAVAVPTVGRPTLERTLAAIVAQGLIEVDQVYVVYDSHHGSNPSLQARAEAFGPHVRYLEHDHGTSDHGIFQTNEAFLASTATLTLAHSDDDMYLPGAFARLREVAGAHPHRPILFQAISPNRRLSWVPGKPKLQRGRLGGSGGLAGWSC